jgi:hypothetical protein
MAPDADVLLGTTNEQLIILCGLRHCTKPRTDGPTICWRYFPDLPAPNMAVSNNDTVWFKKPT